MTLYRIVPERSHVWIDARSNVHPIHSSTDGLEGSVELQIGSDGRVELESPPAAHLSLAVARLSSGNGFEDRELHKRIDARRFPTIEGVLHEIRPSTPDSSYRVSGDVVFRGVTHRHEDRMTIDTVDDHTIRLQGRSRFDIRAFGMEPPKILMLKVEPEVEVRVEIIAEGAR